MKKKFFHQQGQVALIALLVLTIATTVGLSLIARSTTDVAITRNLEESSRAFSAAEAGVELALKTGADVASSGDTSLHTTYSATVSAVVADSSHPLVLPSKTQAGTTETIWLANHKTDGSGEIDDTTVAYNAPIDVCWTAESTTPAIVATILYKSNDGTYRVAKAAFDDPNAGRISGAEANHFSEASINNDSSGPCGAAKYKATVSFGPSGKFPAINPATDVLIALRVRPVYSGTQFTIVPTATLPNQGNQISSLGRTDSGVNRKIIVYQQYKSPATIFDAAVYSEKSLVQ